MSEVRVSSPFSRQPVAACGDATIGELFQHFQTFLDPKEEAILGLRCIGYTWKQICPMLLLTESSVKQLERKALSHMIYLYRNGK